MCWEVPIEEYWGVLLEALRAGDEPQVDHLLQDFKVDYERRIAMPRVMPITRKVA